jgi:hypothetical protein
MKIAIIDTVNQDIGLKILFPEADYFIHNEEDCTLQSRMQSYSKYNFIPNKNLSNITDKNYDNIFIILATYNIVPNTHYFCKNIKNIYEKVIDIVNNNNFKNVFLFDNYDFDYDPNIIINNPKINFIFKRNYNKNKIYKDNVVPFPFIMFGEKSLIEKCDTELVNENDYFKEKISRIFFTGVSTSEYFYEYDKDPNIIRDRQYILNKINHLIYNPCVLNYQEFINQSKNSKFSLDLLGAGDPNKRTFEILMSGSLMISQYSNMLWPFDINDSFSKETIFKNENEFVNVINKFDSNTDLYLKCLENQYYIVKKYFNKVWLRNYILSKM